VPQGGGKQDNYLVGANLSLANDYASLPMAYWPYLVEPWVNGPLRHGKVGISDGVTFQTKPQIALGQDRGGPGRRPLASHRAGRRRLWGRCRLPGWHRLTVSAVLRPFEFRRGQAGASDIKRHGMSSSMRARGQPLTRRVRSSVR